MRLYHSMYQGFLFAMLLALSTNNLGVLWVAMEAATLTTVLLVSLYRTPESIEAAWKYFVLCGVGIAQALFGTVLVYFAAEQKLGSGREDTLLWTVLHNAAGSLDPTVLSLAFVSLLARGDEVIVLSAQLESELGELEPEEAREYLAAVGLEATGLERFIWAGYP